MPETLSAAIACATPNGDMLRIPDSVPAFISARVATAGFSLCTKAVVAICVVLVPAAAVGALGTPVKFGEPTGARLVSVGCR